MDTSSSSPRTWIYRVFTSFHGPDVRKTFLSHLRKQFNYNGITMFDDQGIERGQTIAPSLTEAIRESRISIVVLSKNYASSSWCLNELVEIMECKETMGQIVMTVFYGVDPLDVRKQQTGEFGIIFKETCARKTEEDRGRWSQALKDVGNIAGEHLLNWDNEAKIIEKIARDVSDKLNVTPSWDFDGMVGLEIHLREMQSLLELDYNEVKFVAIYGPAGIGKTTIARALQSLISHKFQLTCFVENLRGNYRTDFDEYGLKLRLQENLLSRILNQDCTRISHLGAIKERLCDLKVLIILDDVNDVKQLEALANETTWFGPGSRIIVTTENKKILQQHGINNTYNVGFPSDEEAFEILCRYAFRKTSPSHGFEKLANSVTWLCGNLPLGLRVVGSCLQGENVDEWKSMIRRLQTDIDRDIEDVLRVGYESLNENEQTLFLHIAVFFNHEDGSLVKAMLAGNNLDIQFSLKILVNRSLIYTSTNGEIVIHKLLQQVGMQAIHRQRPWKRQILIDSQEICDVLENGSGTRAVSGISFDTSGINEVIVSNKALQRMRNLRFLSVYKTKNDGNDRVHIPEEMEFPPCLRLLHWEAYPSKSLPRKFCLQNLVELDMRGSKLEKLWEGTQPLTNLKKINLSWSVHLKELPDLSKATNLEKLNMNRCKALVEFPSSIGNLQKLQELRMDDCKSLEVIPTYINLESLWYLHMNKCSHLRTFPNFSTNIEYLILTSTALVELPSSLLEKCESLQRVTSPLNTANVVLRFTNCFKLNGEARRLLIQGSYFGYEFAFLPGRIMPSEFNHRARGNSLTIPLSWESSSKFKACVMISPNHIRKSGLLNIRCIIGSYSQVMTLETAFKSPRIRTEYMCVFHGDMPEVSCEAKFEFQTEFWADFEDESLLENYDIIECGVRIITDEPEISSKVYDDSSYKFEFDSESDNLEGQEKNNTDCWSWLFLCFDLSNIVKNIGRLCWGRKQIESIDRIALHEHR